MNKIYLGWEEFGVMVDKLVELIKKSRFKFDGVCGIPRGGIILAVCLAYKLNLPLYNSIVTDNILVCDDISDTGKILKNFGGKNKGKKITTLYTTTWTSVQPDFTVKLKWSKDDWIVFPWEKE